MTLPAGSTSSDPSPVTRSLPASPRRRPRMRIRASSSGSTSANRSKKGPITVEKLASVPPISTSGLCTELCARWGGSETSFTVDTDSTVPDLVGVTRSFPDFPSALDEIVNARIWGGIHFRFRGRRWSATRNVCRPVHPGEFIPAGIWKAQWSVEITCSWKHGAACRRPTESEVQLQTMSMVAVGFQTCPDTCEERTCTDEVRLGKQVGRYVFRTSLTLTHCL